MMWLNLIACFVCFVCAGMQLELFIQKPEWFFFAFFIISAYFGFWNAWQIFNVARKAK